MVNSMRKVMVLYGVGVNDSEHKISTTLNGRRIICPIYQKWIDMLKRCYGKNQSKKNPTYAGCTVCSEWFSFKAFKSWVETQDWVGKALDKDILVDGNKVYSPEFCVFVTKDTNTFTTDRKLHRGNCPLGVSWQARIGKYQAECSNPFKRKSEYLGVFSSPDEAHLAWKRRKHEIACEIANQQSDVRVAEALRKRYVILEDSK